MRLFIASSIERFPQLEPLFEELEGISYCRPVRTRELHLTFRFLGEVSEKNYESLRDGFLGLELKRFTLRIDGLGAFPKPGRAKVLFLNVMEEEQIFEDWRLISMLPPASELNDRFVPHITVARFKRPYDCRELSAKYRSISFKADAERISLYRSLLTPDGPIYNELEKLQLK